MKQVIFSRFGDESVLETVEQPVPSIRDNEVLVRVKAVSINPLDWKIYQGQMKLMSGSTFPKSVGIDFSGSVAGLGSAVSRFSQGEDVFGLKSVFKGGALAEYVVVKESEITRKPDNVSFEEAAALPVVGLSAQHIAGRLAGVSKNQDVLINGAAGGVGMLLIQIAKARGARVTAIVGPAGIDQVSEWGADEVIDYKKTDVRKLDRKFDAVIDLSTTLSFGNVRKWLKTRSVFVSTLATPGILLSAAVHNLFSKQKYKVLLLKPGADQLQELGDLAKNSLRIRLHKVYAFADVEQAYRESRRGHIVGKAVIVL